MTLLNNHFGALRADFQRYYNLDIDDIYGGALSVMRAADLAAYLPPGAVVWLESDSPAAWGAQEYLIATLIDDVNLFAWGQLSGKQSEMPQPTPRPGKNKAKQEKSRYTAMSIEEYEAFRKQKFIDISSSTHKPQESE